LREPIVSADEFIYGPKLVWVSKSLCQIKELDCLIQGKRTLRRPIARHGLKNGKNIHLRNSRTNKQPQLKDSKIDLLGLYDGIGATLLQYESLPKLVRRKRVLNLAHQNL
jgi:hypothetical protein